MSSVVFCREAVGRAGSCGHGISVDCDAKTAGRTYAESGFESDRPKMSTVPPAVGAEAPPKPGRTFTRAFFIIGAVGIMLTLIAATLAWIFRFGPPLSQYIGNLASLFSGLLECTSGFAYTVLYAIFGTGATLAGIGFAGYRRNYGSSMGLAACIITPFFAWWLLASGLLTNTGLVGHWEYYFFTLNYHSGPLYSLYFALQLLASVLGGVMFVLWGVAMLVARRRTGARGLATAAGALLIVVGSFWCSWIGRWIGEIMLIPAAIVAMISLLMSRPPGSPI